MNFSNQVCVVTGGSGGIGRVAAKQFVEAGGKVMLVDLDEAALKDVVAELGEENATCFAADVTDEAQVQAYVQATLDRFGRIDCFLNNAGIEGRVAPIVDYPVEEFDRVIAVNVRGVWLGLKYVMPVMAKAGGGSIVITSSTAGIKGGPGLSPYVTSKHAVIGMMRSSSREGAANNVRVNTVNPSPTETRMMRSLEAGILPDQPEQAKQAMAASIPLGRYAEPEDVANLMLFLCSGEASFLTGGVYMVDGGTSAT